MTHSNWDFPADDPEVMQGALGILQKLLDESYAANAKLNNRVQEEIEKTRKAQYARDEAKRRYNDLVERLQFTYPEDD